MNVTKGRSNLYRKRIHMSYLDLENVREEDDVSKMHII